MKKVTVFTLTVLITFILSSCGNFKDVQDELLNYYNEEWLPISVWYEEKIEGPVDEIFEVVFDTNDEEDPEIIRIREKETLPATKEVIERFKSIEPEYKKIKKLNDLQIEVYELDRDSDKAAIEHSKGIITSDELYETWGKLRKKKEEFNEYLEKILSNYNLEKDPDKFHGYNLYEVVKSE